MPNLFYYLSHFSGILQFFAIILKIILLFEKLIIFLRSISIIINVDSNNMEKINLLSPLFRDMTYFYICSNIGSYDEARIIDEIYDRYKEIFYAGKTEICDQYLDAFFIELCNRLNIKHIQKIKEMFGGEKNDKSKNKIYQRFVIILAKTIKNGK